MKRMILGVLVSMAAINVNAQQPSPQTQCLIHKYDTYIDASLTWYQDLVRMTTSQDPQLADVGQWYYAERKNHFELNREMVHEYLHSQPQHIATDRSVESWLSLSQDEIRQLAQQDTKLGHMAAKSFADRQATPHPQNYAFRSALAQLLSHPDQINTTLTHYNNAMAKIAKMDCK